MNRESRKGKMQISNIKICPERTRRNQNCGIPARLDDFNSFTFESLISDISKQYPGRSKSWIEL